MKQTDAPSLEEFATPKALVRMCPNLELTDQQMNWALRHRETNGLAPAVTKMGRNLVIHIPTFTRWLLGGGNIKNL